jgi:hypothetical protein
VRPKAGDETLRPQPLNWKVNFFAAFCSGIPWADSS